MLSLFLRWTCQKLRRLTARTRNAGSTLFTRLPSTRKERIAFLLRGSVVMTASSQDMVGRQSLFSTRRFDLDFSMPCKLKGLTTSLFFSVSSAARSVNLLTSSCLIFVIQAKTTKKIVLKLQCQSCKHYSQHPIKVFINAFSFFFSLIIML